MLTDSLRDSLRAHATVAANATLTGIADGGFSEDYDQPAGSTTAKWTGSLPVYYSERTERLAATSTGTSTQSAVATDVIVSRSVTIFQPPLTIEQGDIVTIDLDGEIISGSVRAVARRAITVVVQLEDA